MKPLLCKAVPVQSLIKDVTDLSWSYADDLLATTTMNGSVILWDTQTGLPCRAWQCGSAWGLGVSYHPGGQLVATMADNESLSIFNKANMKNQVLSHCLLPTGVDGKLENLRLFDHDDSSAFKMRLIGCNSNCHSAPLADVRFSDDGRFLVPSSIDGHLSFISFSKDELDVLMESACWTSSKEVTRSPYNPFPNVDSVDNYLLAAFSEKICERRKRAILLNFLGTEGQRLFYSLQPKDDSYESTLEVLSAFFTPKVNVCVEPYRFRKRRQTVEDSVDRYIADLRELASTCAFGPLEDELLRDQLIEDKAITIAKQMETAKKEASCLLTATADTPVNALNRRQQAPALEKRSASSKLGQRPLLLKQCLRLWIHGPSGECN
ncbi:hypothetical protein M513_09832 [Trichuris suis]|uniref:Uncharacterized protein n=1 Tax=Trichuris suis TaxID=68888 RepID=A0A085LWD4_9BILA|nr:hypothetical protein M513_09832 [Trichuris suis]